ncbi:hypothetical protein D3C72_1956610 [compost metagenome]
MMATCELDELSATARLKCCVGTMLTSTACVAGIMKARALPNSTSTANTGQTMDRPFKVKASRASAQASCAARQQAMMLRRL